MNTETDAPEPTVAHGRALVRAIEALDAIAATDRIGQKLANQLMATYQRQLEVIAETAPSSVSEAILKEKTLVKSRQRCCVCHQFAGQDINVYHIDPDVKDTPDTLEEAIVLCLRCHAEAVYASSQHLPGDRYSPEELRRHRDLWWEWCEENPDITIPTMLEIDRGHLYIPFPSPAPDTLPEPGPLPPGSHLPFGRNVFFAGRSEALNTLANALLPRASEPQSPILITQAAQGGGGVGKTQLAIEFAYRYGRFFRGIHWLDGTQPEILGTAIAVCGEEMDLPYWPEKQSDQVSRTLDEWREGGARLVILDNIEDVDAVQEWLDRLSGGPTRLLLTARRSDWPTDLGLHLLPLDVFAPEESVAFLRQYLPQQRATDDELAQLAEQVGHLPLTLDLAGRYLAVQLYLSVADYLDLAETVWSSESMTAWRKALGQLVGHDLKLATTFALSWEQVTDETAGRLFLLAGHCAPNRAVPREILEEAAGLGPETYDESIAGLVDLGLLDMGDTGPITHPLLARYTHTLPEESPLPALTSALAHLAREANKRVDQSGSLSHFVPLLPHVYAVTERAKGEDLETMGTLWNSLGYYLDRVEDHAAARSAFERALAIWQTVYGEVNPQAATAHSNVGGALQALGDLTGALASFERALAIDEKIYGPDHPDVARDMSNLGNVLLAMGDLKGAWSAYVCASAILEHVLGEDHPNVAIQFNKVGVVLQKLDDLPGAQDAFERALRIFEGLLPPGHPYIKAVQENLEILEGTLDPTALSRLAMHPIPADGPTRYFVCPECGTIREEVLGENGMVAVVRYHELSSGMLSKVVAEKARAILERLKPERLKLLDE